MGLLNSIFANTPGGMVAEGVKGAFQGIGALAKDLRSAITGEISPEKKADLLEKTLTLEAMANSGQLEINKAEAQNPSVFVSGPRPAFLWVGAISLACYFIPQYVMAAILWTRQCWSANALAPFPIAEPAGLMELCALLLGVAGLRTIEKIKGVARN